MDGKAKVKAAEAETKMKIATGEISWEQSAIEASNHSWKDELWTVVFVFILAANFIPSLQDTMAEDLLIFRTAPRGCRLECMPP